MTERALETLVLATLASCLLLALVLVLRAPVARFLGARWAYYLWVVPLLSLLAMAVPTALVTTVLATPAIPLPASGWFLDRLAGEADVVVTIWLIGAVVCLGLFVLRNTFSSLVTFGASRELTFEERQLVRDRCAGLARRMEVDFRLLSSREGPAVAGLIRPVLLLPRDFFSRYSSQQQRLMLQHELQHLCRRDLLSLSLAGTYRSLFWFNPLVWLGGRLMRLDQELSCDERVVSGEPAATRRLYGLTMLQAAQPHVPETQLNYPASFREMHRRTSFLRRGRTHGLLNGIGLALLLAASAGSVLVGASATLERDASIRPALASELDAISRELASQPLKHETMEAFVQRLRRLALTNTVPPWTAYESARIQAELGTTLAHLGQHDQALQAYDKALKHGRHWPEVEARILMNEARVYFADGAYSETLKLLVRAESLAPAEYLPNTWALRGLALAKLGIWDQALIGMDHAVRSAQARGETPSEDWFFALAALRMNQNDTDGAAQALEAARLAHPDTTHAQRLQLLNRFIQDSWAPEEAEQLLTHF